MSTILVVDDSDSIRRFCQEELEADGYRVVLARDGDEALHVLTQAGADLVVMDVHMPRCGGLDAVRKIERHAPEVPVVLHTSAPGDWGRRTGLPCVAKTEDLTALRATIEGLLAGSNADEVIGSNSSSGEPLLVKQRADHPITKLG
jgi:CheY-like chemotaxis protein